MAETDKNVREERSDDLTALGIGAGIATGILGRTPLIRAGKKIFQGIKSLKKGPEEDLPNIQVPPKKPPEPDSFGGEMIENFKLSKAELDDNVKVVEEIQQRVKDNPLTLAGRNAGPDVDPSVHGSVLFDTIATFPNMGRKKGYQAPAKAWADYFKTASQKKGITRDELADTNIALFDKDQNLTGGYLKIAMDNDIPVGAKTLLEMVARSPANNTGSVRLGYNQKVLREASEDFFNTFEDNMGRLRTQLVNRITSEKSYGNLDHEAKLTEVRRLIDEVSDQYFTNKTNFQMRNYGHSAAVNKDSDALFGNFARTLNKQFENTDAASGVNAAETLENAGIPYEEFMMPIFTKGKIFNDMMLSQANKLSSEKRLRYGDQDSYRLFGAEDYHEDVVYLKDIEGGKKGNIFGEGFKMPRASHFSEVAENQLYHLRYGTRAVKGAPGEKAYVLDEMQADIQQRMRDKVRNKGNFASDRDVRLNPTNMNYFLPLFKDKRIDKYNQINEFLRNEIMTQGRLSAEANKKYNNLIKEFDEISKAQKDQGLSAATRKELIDRYNRAEGDFQPLLDVEKGYGAHGMKYLAKTAAKNDIDYIAINPVEMVAIGKRGGDVKKFTPRFYGNAKGTAGFRGYSVQGEPTNPNQTAILPNILKRLAKEYNTEAKVIQVAKSDPTKPYKIVRTKAPKTYGEESFPYTSTEHFSAFSTKREAELALENYNLEVDGKVVYMDPLDPDLYYPAFGLKITPDMNTKPFKLYKKTGGLVVNIFKW